MTSLSSIAADLQNGRSDEAATLQALLEVLALEPEHGDALTLAGFCLVRLGRAAEAQALLDRVLAREPGRWLAWANRAEARLLAGDKAGAAEDYRQAAALRPCPEFFINLASLLDELGDQPGRREALNRALDLDPTSPGALNNLGLWHEDAGEKEQALACFELAAASDPESRDVAENLSRLLITRAKPLEDGDPECLREFLETTLARYPRLPAFHLRLGEWLLARHENERAGEHFSRLIELQPENPTGYANYAITLHRQKRLEEALDWHRRAAALKGADGIMAEMRAKRAFSLLLLGRLREGFADAEARNFSKTVYHEMPAPRWDGRPFPNQTLLLHTEQGFGDSIHFIRYAAMAKALSPTGTVAIACEPALERLFHHVPGIDLVTVLPQFPKQCHWQIPLLSLPYVFGTEMETIPASIPYIDIPKPPASQGPRPLRIALIWFGNPKYQDNHRRSCPLSFFAPLGMLPGIEWISLQCGPAAAEMAACPWLHDLSPGLTDFYETALRIQEVDLVISVDTSVAHLVGALGKPLWLLLHQVPDWRWLLDRNDCPWYPTARLFRQERDGEWGSVIADVETALREKLENP